MDKKKIPTNTITRDVKYLAEPTGNIYKSVAIIYKRANQIAQKEKTELNKKLDEFKNDRDGLQDLQEVFENREQIEISKYYERRPKPVLTAIEEFAEGELFFRDAGADGVPKQTICSNRVERRRREEAAEAEKKAYAEKKTSKK